VALNFREIGLVFELSSNKQACYLFYLRRKISNIFHQTKSVSNCENSLEFSLDFLCEEDNFSCYCYHRLLVTEQAGKACRDDSVEGLRFYPNLFLERSD